MPPEHGRLHRPTGPCADHDRISDRYARKSISENRLQPMFKAAPELRKRFDENSQLQELQFDGMYLTLAGSNSPSSLASKAIRFLFLDEVDKYPGASKKEADPVSLARERTKTFHNRKIFITSTPTLKQGISGKPRKMQT